MTTVLTRDIFAANIDVPTPVNNNDAANKAYVDSKATPTGSTLMFAGTVAPTGWLLCDGLAVSRSTYAALFAVIGTAFGVGNGSTTFNVPDISGMIGVDASFIVRSHIIKT
jgi:phage-related tail fiber protein